MTATVSTSFQMNSFHFVEGFAVPHSPELQEKILKKNQKKDGGIKN
ncbi:MAG: hypothetical protein J6W26_00810 [Bacteroidales bacterium]|nr:hypothetical protein [Bacteroidales bacterium]